MALLFVDSTYDVTLGILDDQLGWSEFKRFDGKKASVILQPEIYNILRNHGIQPQELEGIVTVAGPGFYTGLRLSEGLADVFSFFKIPLHSFYSYQIPSLCGINRGVWVTKAYRGEYFFHHWDGLKSDNVLVSSKELATYMEGIKEEIFIHSIPALDQICLELMNDPMTTNDLLLKNSAKIFKKILDQKMLQESYYFRAPEDEFKVST